MSEVYWLSQAFDMIKRYVACVQAAFADPHLVRFEMTTNFGCALNAESIIDCLSQKKFYAIPSYQRAYKWDTEHVTRLLSEICRYYYDSTQKFQSCVGYDLTKHAKFIGTVILVRDEQLKKKGSSSKTPVAKPDGPKMFCSAFLNDARMCCFFANKIVKY